MRTRSLILGTFLLLWLSAAFSADKGAAIFKNSAPTQNALVEPLKAAYGHVITEDFVFDEKQVFVVIFDTASGTSRKSALVYLRRSQEAPWMLLLYRATNSSSITLRTEERSLVAYSKAGKKLFLIPFDSMSLSFDAAEQ